MAADSVAVVDRGNVRLSAVTTRMLDARACRAESRSSRQTLT